METPDTEVKPKPQFRAGLKGVWRHVKPYKRFVLVLLFLGVISAIANGLVPYITGRFFDALIQVSKGQGTDGPYPLWAVLLTAWAFVQILANGSDWIKDRLSRTLVLKVRFNIETRGFSHFLYLPLSYHTNTQIHGEISKLNMGAWRITSIVGTIVEIAPQLLSVMIGITLAIRISPLLAGILALGVLVYVISIIPMLIPIAGADSIAHRAWNDIWNDATEAVHQVSYVKEATAEAYQEQKTSHGFFGVVYGLWMKLERTWNNISFYQRVIVFLTQLSVFVASVHFVANGTLTVGELVALNGYALMFFGPFVALGTGWQTIQNGLTAAEQLEEIFSIPTENYHPKGAITPKTNNGEVTFENVSFEYEAGKDGVLSGVDFHTKPGETVALVGESGAGKSTAISLISGYYFPTTGSVHIDGVNTKAWDLVELRKRIAIVPQEVALFNDSIRSNIRYGTFEATDADIEEAAKEAHIHDFILGLPKGYETVVGERGVKLSVGQKQRVAIARAILRNPEILILDEPTSALDSQTEKLITESLEKLMKGRTTFIIAHRLSTVRKADKILLLKAGKIAEQGSHDELMALSGGDYRNLYELHIGLHE
ncbi:MAG: ABC transporter ATP-binding protein [Candidatus Paceibacterota bacterium]